MLTDEKTVLVACSNLPKNMGSDCGRQIPVDDSSPSEFRNHLSDWLAVMTEAAGIAAVVPEIVPSSSKTDWDGLDGGTTSADDLRTPGRIITTKISRS